MPTEDVVTKDGKLKAIDLQATSANVVTKSDSTTFAPSTLYIGTAGDVVVDTMDGQTDITFKNVPSGAFLPVLVVKVKAATTAADIVRLS